MAASMTASIFSDLGERLDDLTEWLDTIGGKWWFLLVILVIAYFDSFFPVVPSETAVIIGGVAAGRGDQTLALVILAGATGAFLGDNFAYFLGSRFSPWIRRRAETRPKTARRLEWARSQIRMRGGPLLITARFIPGGRTALTTTSGLTHQPRRWFAKWVAVAGLIWASYASSLGYIFGNRFKDNHTAAFGIAFAAAISITLLIELVRHLRNRRSPANEGVQAVAETVIEPDVEAVAETVSETQVGES